MDGVVGRSWWKVQLSQLMPAIKVRPSSSVVARECRFSLEIVCFQKMIAEEMRQFSGCLSLKKRWALSRRCEDEFARLHLFHEGQLAARALPVALADIRTLLHSLG